MTILGRAWALQYRIEDWYASRSKRLESESNTLEEVSEELESRSNTLEKPSNKWEVSSDLILVAGLGMGVLGFVTHYLWWVIGGAALFYMGAMTLPGKGDI